MPVKSATRLQKVSAIVGAVGRNSVSKFRLAGFCSFALSSQKLATLCMERNNEHIVHENKKQESAGEEWRFRTFRSLRKATGWKMASEGKECFEMCNSNTSHQVWTILCSPEIAKERYLQIKHHLNLLSSTLKGREHPDYMSLLTG